MAVMSGLRLNIGAIRIERLSAARQPENPANALAVLRYFLFKIKCFFESSRLNSRLFKKLLKLFFSKPEARKCAFENTRATSGHGAER